MNLKKIRLFAVLIFLIAVLAVIWTISYKATENKCMGVEMLTEADMSRFVTPVQQELSGWFQYNGSIAPCDIGKYVIYISQNINETTTVEDIRGQLLLLRPEYNIYFAPDEMFGDLDKAAEQQHEFRLIVDQSGGEYSEYSVVFVNMPVIRMNGPRIYTTDDKEEFHQGEFTLWDGGYVYSGGKDKYHTSANWTTADGGEYTGKYNNYKISLTNADGGNPCDLLGMGRDDDWMLYSPKGDASGIRTQVASMLWNAIGKTKLPEGEFVHLVYNGENYGVRLLSRRVDRKFLDLDSEDMLLRDKKLRRGSYVKNNYTLLSGYYTAEQMEQIVEPFHTMSDLSQINIDSWIDINIYNNITNCKNKFDYSEVYYIYKRTPQGFSISFAPEYSRYVLGIEYDDDEKMLFNEESAQHEVGYRREYDKLREIYSDLDSRIAERYAQLRKASLTREKIAESIASAQTQHGSTYDEFVQQLGEYINARLEYLDVYYDIK